MAEGETRLEIRRLEDEDEIEQFYCGDEDLDGFLKEDARRLEAQDVTRVYVAVIGRRVYGYMAILADTIELKTNERKKLKLKHDDPRQIPALKIGRLAIDKAFREEYRGTGKALMGLAFRNGLIVAETAGCRLLTVDAYLESVEFYEAKLGFIRNKFKAPATEQPPQTLEACVPTDAQGNGGTHPESQKIKPTVSLRFDLKIDSRPEWTLG